MKFASDFAKNLESPLNNAIIVNLICVILEYFKNRLTSCVNFILISSLFQILNKHLALFVEGAICKPKVKLLV